MCNRFPLSLVLVTTKSVRVNNTKRERATILREAFLSFIEICGSINTIFFSLRRATKKVFFKYLNYVLKLQRLCFHFFFRETFLSIFFSRARLFLLENLKALQLFFSLGWKFVRVFISSRIAHLKESEF